MRSHNDYFNICAYNTTYLKCIFSLNICTYMPCVTLFCANLILVANLCYFILLSDNFFYICGEFAFYLPVSAHGFWNWFMLLTLVWWQTLVYGTGWTGFVNMVSQLMRYSLVLVIYTFNLLYYLWSLSTTFTYVYTLPLSGIFRSIHLRMLIYHESVVHFIYTSHRYCIKYLYYMTGIFKIIF